MTYNALVFELRRLKLTEVEAALGYAVDDEAERLLRLPGNPMARRADKIAQAMSYYAEDISEMLAAPEIEPLTPNAVLHLSRKPTAWAVATRIAEARQDAREGGK